MDSRSPAVLRSADDSLSCKVMRLTKPSLMLANPVLCSETDLPGPCLNQQHLNDLATLKDTPQFGLSELLTLPQNFGNIFLGETFSSYISVHNDSNQICKDILVKADLQTSSQRLVLSGGTNAQPVAQLPPATSIDDVIHHEVKELGTHILVCAVNYTTASGEKMYFRKFFKFQVLKPLDVKTKFYNAESDEVYLEAQIQNITPGPIYMEKVNLEPSQLYNSQELNSIDPKEKDKLVFGEVNYMNPLDTRQYLYCLTPKSELYVDNKIVKGVTNIGKMDIVWKTNMGEKGRLQTSALQRVAPGFGDIRLVVEFLPDAVQLESTFNVAFKVINCCERTMDLVVSLHNQPKRGLQWAGISGTQLGRLSPNSSVDLKLSMIPVSPGLHAISGLRFTDTFLKRTYEHDDISHVFVYSSSLD